MKLRDLVRVAPRKIKDELKNEKRKNNPEEAIMPVAKGDGVGKGSDAVDPQNIA